MLESRNPERKDNELAPKTVDFNVIGACNLDCLWCWGPDHKVRHKLSAQDWIEVGKQLKKEGTENIVITGGEPLLRKDLLEIIVGLKTLGLRVTLSTNAMLLNIDRNIEILKYIDEIGIPLDGSTSAMNSTMRKGDPRSYDSALSAIKLVQEKYPNIKLTVRTVLSKKNLSDVENIPNILIQRGIDLKKLRWKIYQIVPTGPRKFRILLESGDWLIDEQTANSTVEHLRKQNPNITIKYQDIDSKLNRYLHIDPTGDIFTLAGDGTEVKQLGYVKDENKRLNVLPVLKDLHDSEYKVTDLSHGSENF